MSQRISHILKFKTLLACALSLFFIVNTSGASEYGRWLKENGALDAYARLLKDKPNSPKRILKRARVYFDLEEYSKTRNLLKQYESKFTGNATGKRLILLGRAYRNTGKFVSAIDSFSQAAEFMNNAEYKKSIENVPGLERLFPWVWKKHFWNILGPESLDKKNAKLLTDWSRSALLVWPESDFWNMTQGVTNNSKSFLPDNSNASHFSFNGDSQKLYRLFAAWSLSEFGVADKIIQKLDSASTPSFWKFFNKYLKNSIKKSQHLSFNGSYTKPTKIFKNIFRYELSTLDQKDAWTIHSPQIRGWESYWQGIKQKSVEEKLQALVQEYNSALLAQEVKSTLAQMILAYNLLRGEIEDLPTKKETGKLPLCLQLALALAHENPQYIRAPAKKFVPLLRELLLAANVRISETGIYKTWREKWNIKKSKKEDPGSPSLDYLQNYLFLKQKLSTKDNNKAAKALAFLYPHTTEGQAAFLSLARNAYRKGNKKTAWDYLKKIQKGNFRANREAELLKAKAGVLMDLGREKESLDTYALLLEHYPYKIKPKKKLKLALAAQQKDNWEWAQKILNNLWAQRNKLRPKLKAEILFWIGEGKQMQGDVPGAIDSYLRVAWKYKKENIWAVTAMYRAGLLYEERGMAATARHLYKKVLKRADRDSQKKAARQRLNSLSTKNKGDNPSFPLF